MLRLGNFDVLADPTYRGAIRALGRAGSCDSVRTFPQAIVSSPALGVKIELATYGGIPKGKTFCSAPEPMRIHVIHVSGRAGIQRASCTSGPA